MVGGSPLPNGDGVDEMALSSFSFSKEFEKHLPYFLSVGMTYSQFWDDDVELCNYYRKADDMRKKRKNEELWLQGLYIYDALVKVSPLFRAVGASKPDDYPKEPYPLTEEERDNRERRDEELKFRQMLEKMAELTTQKRGESNGDSNT